MLHTLFKENLPTIYEKIIKLNVSIELIFGRYLLTMCSGLFSNELVYRIWDLLFYTYN